MPGFWGESAQSMEKSSPRECGLALLPAAAPTSVYPRPVMAPPWASGSSPVKRGSPSCCEEEALTEGAQGCLSPSCARHCPGPPSLCPHLSVSRAPKELLLGEKVGAGVSWPGWDAAAFLALGDPQTDCVERGAGAWGVPGWEWPRDQ